MTYSKPEQFTNVTATCKANIYFDGKVVSHTITFDDNSRKTIGLIYPGTYKFDTAEPEVMEIIAGSCRVKIAGKSSWQVYNSGEYFEVPGRSHFTIEVESDIAEYVCSFK